MKTTDRTTSEDAEEPNAAAPNAPQRVLFHLAWIGALGLMAGFGLVLLFMF